MAQLTVTVAGAGEEARLLTLPVDVYAPDGSLLASGTAAPDRVARFDLAMPQGVDLDRVHVLGKLPSGVILQQTAQLLGGRGEASLHLGDESPHEWLQWATPFRSLGHLRAAAGPDVAESRRIGKVWMTLWAFSEGRWESQAVEMLRHLRDSGMQQFVLDVPPRPHLLQIGGEEVAWRLVSLPPGGPVRVALTRSPSKEGDSLEVTLGRSRPDNELIMSYLARGAVAEADRLAEAWQAANLMLYEKKNDPVSAAAGAYLLLKNHRLQDRRRWVDNLVDWFPYMADGAIVSAALALQRQDAAEASIRAKVKLALRRGLPVFALGATILVETMAALHRGKRETKSFHASYLAAQAYARARCSTGAYLAFYGKSPAEPVWTPIYGLEAAPSAGPISAGQTDRIIHSRPVGGAKVGQFGDTRVALPRAPVSPELARSLRTAADRPDGSNTLDLIPATRLRLPDGTDKLFRQTVDLGIPALETPFLEDLSTAPRRSIARDSLTDSESRERVAYSRPLGNAVKRAPRQTSSFWRDERIKHAVPLFTEDE